MDTNKLIRLLLLSISVMVYLYIFRAKPNPTTASDVKDNTLSIAGQHNANEKIDTPFTAALIGEEKTVTVENECMKVVLSTKGGMIQKVVLKKYKDQHGQPLVILDKQSSHMGFLIPYKDLVIDTQSLYFQNQSNDAYKLSLGQKAIVTFRLEIGPAQYIEHLFEFVGNSYEIHYRWKTMGMEHYSDNKKASFCWNMDMKRLEPDDKDTTKGIVNYYLSDETLESLKTTQPETKQVAKPIKWVNIKQCFFSSAIIANDAFATGELHTTPAPSNKDIAKTINLSLVLPEKKEGMQSGTFKFFFGPNLYKTLQSVHKGFEKNLPLGWTVVRWVNIGLIMPLFSFLENHITNYGLIILLLVIIIKSLLIPLSYKSYIAMATMKIVKPELDKIKEKYGNNLQKIQAEQMVLYRELGINPLSGCMPIVLQMPILLAMFNFFPNMISFRQVSFLWAKDLSTYDSILQLPFTIPIYGNHVSLFTILMVLSTILYAKATNPNSTEGAMKIVSYIMPISFMFVLNSFPAGLSFYYSVSNMVTFLQQKLINHFVDEENIKAKLLTKKQWLRQKGKTPFQSRVIETMQLSHKKKK